MNDKEATIRIEGLSERFEDIKAVDGLSLEIRRGELFGLLGPNGAGKTTIIKILSGLLEPTSGSVRVDGYDAWRQQEKVKELIGVCPQETGVFPFLTGRENIEFFGDMQLVPKDILRKRVNEMLEKMSLTKDADRRTKTYSGGMQRRISLLMALVGDPDIAFLDEPTVGMDPQSRRAVWEFIKELKAKGKTIILTTHYMEEAEELCDRVGIIDRGRIITLGTPRDLIREHHVANLEEVFIKLTGDKMRRGD